LEICFVKDEVAFRIRKLRESKDFSQENMANDLNITPSAYSKIERGVTDPSIGRLAQIASILGVEITYFFEDIKGVSIEEKQISYGYATKEDLEKMYTTMKDLIREELLSLKKELKVARSVSSKKKK
jgi:transcriptional regulator with XRE-family HTH domain